MHLGVVAAAVAALDRFAGPEKQWRGEPNQTKLKQEGNSTDLGSRPL